MYDERSRRFVRKEIPATCPFCKKKIHKPKPMDSGVISPGTKAGRCECGAVYVFDEAGKGGGEAIMDGLNLLCDGDVERAMALQPKVDYRMIRRGYRPRTNSYDPQVKKKGALKQPKLWFFCLKRTQDEQSGG